MRTIGVTSRGVRTPIIKPGDDIVEIVVNSVKEAWENEGFEMHDKDVVGITESVVGRAQKNYASVDQIAKDVKAKTGGGNVGMIFPILSRNRFSVLLQGICKGVEKLTIMLSYPADEVGNHLISLDEVDAKGLDPYKDVLDEKKFHQLFGEHVVHQFTGVDYVDFYKSMACNNNVEIIFGNDPTAILDYTDTVICADIHSRERSKRLLKAKGAKCVIGLDDLLTSSVDGSGYNSKYGLLGSNKATEDSVKLFPEHCQEVVDGIARKLKELTGKNIEVMIYGDGAFKDPVGKIWELADPVVSPAYTPGLKGTPNELKMKYLADTKFADLSGDELKQAMVKEIQSKDADLVGSMASEGTTPRQLTDLLGSLCDLTSGSGDKGTPVILIQGYFDNYATEK